MAYSVCVICVKVTANDEFGTINLKYNIHGLGGVVTGVFVSFLYFHHYCNIIHTLVN